MEDASLDDFLGGERAGDEAGDNPDEDVVGDGEEPERRDDEFETDEDVTTADTEREPATATMVYAPEGAACDGCGEVVNRRWRADGGLHCLACKEW